jgi:hypothetical protein
MFSEESVSFNIFIPICQEDRESSNLFLYYRGLGSNDNRSHSAFEWKHAANGDLQERLTVLMTPAEGRGKPARCVWQLDERMPDAPWVREILTQLATTRAFELREFLAQCLRDARRDPAKPFQAVFSTAVKSYGF